MHEHPRFILTGSLQLRFGDTTTQNSTRELLLSPTMVVNPFPL